MADIMKMGKNANFLGSWDLYDVEGQQIAATIHDIRDEEVINNGKSEQCTVLMFEEDIKPMILNLTNKKTLTKLYKTKETKKLIGKRITIIYEKVKAFGKVSDALRIKSELPSAVRKVVLKCEQCGNDIQGYGKLNAAQLAEYTAKKYGKKLCNTCASAEAEKNDHQEETHNGTDE